MGVEYRHFLFPASRPFRPSAGQVVELIQALEAGRWLGGHGTVKTAGSVTPLPSKLTVDSLEELIAGDAILTWTVERIEDAGLEYPFEVESVDPDTYYDLQMHFARDFVHHVSDVFEPLEKTRCCGKTLEIDAGEGDIFYASRIKVTCPTCQQAFDPSATNACARDPWTGEARRFPGGGAYRFAIVVDCGKWLPGRTDPVALRSAFLDVCERALGQTLVNSGDAY